MPAVEARGGVFSGAERGRLGDSTHAGALAGAGFGR